MKLLRLPFLLFLLTPAIGFCGIPSFSSHGLPVVWDTSQTITYRVDPGSLGQLQFNDALQLLQAAMDEWEALADSGIQFEYLGPTSADITPANHDFFSDQLFNSTSDENLLIIFDSDGSIIDSYGVDNTIAAGLTQLGAHSSSAGSKLYAAEITLNGLFYDGDPTGADMLVPDSELGVLMTVFVHELGHALGLDHTSLNQQFFSIDPEYLYMPTMYPYALGRHQADLSPDEKAETLWMYGASQPVLSGHVYDANGNPVDSLLVTARNIRSPYCRAYGVITGWPNSSDAGGYSIPVLESGDYVIEVSKWSSTTPLSGGAEFYNEADISNENYDTLSVVHVEGNVTGLDFNLGPAVTTPSTTINKNFYSSRSDIFTIPVDDEWCPAQLDAGILDLIGPDPTAAAAPSTGNGSNGSANDAPISSTAGSQAGASSPSSAPAGTISNDTPAPVTTVFPVDSTGDTLPPAGDPVEAAPLPDSDGGTDSNATAPASGCSLHQSDFSKNRK